MSYCQSCGGQIGVYCFNPQECACITQQMEIESRLAEQREQQRIEEYQRHTARSQLAVSIADAILAGWEEWDAEAQQAAQVDQDERSWRHVMRTRVASALWDLV